MKRDCRRRATVARVLAGIALTALAAATAQAASRSAALGSAELTAQARGIEVGGRLEVTGVTLPGESDARTLALERIDVMAPEAKIIVHGHAGDYEIPFPQDLHFRGALADDPSSLALLTIEESGAVRGFLSTDTRVVSLGQVWSPRRDSVSPRVRDVDLGRAARAGGAEWQCGNASLQTPVDPIDELLAALPGRGAPEATTTRYNIDIAFDTDYEFWALFGSDTAAASYITTLAAGASTIYDRDVNAVWRVSRIDLYNAGMTMDPWEQTGSFCGLYEVGNYWNANRGAVDRDLVHFLSGKTTNAGIAWVGVLCRADFACFDAAENCGGPLPTCSPTLPDPSYGGAYAWSGGIDGDYTGGIVWDILVVTHEGGHNFNSPHTHCYNLPATPGTEVIDECSDNQASSGCWAGAESVPPGPMGGGSIMSYCNQVPPDFIDNVHLYLGRAGWYGTDSDRVQTVIRDEIEDNLACLDVATACSTGEHLVTVTGSEPGTADHEACSKLILDAYTTQSTATVTGTSPLIEVTNGTTFDGTVTLSSAVP